MPTTAENLKEAFAGESQASEVHRFLEEGGTGWICQCGEALPADGGSREDSRGGTPEGVDGIGTTLENLQAAVAGRPMNSRRCTRRC